MNSLDNMTDEERKECPIYSGFVKYFPLAMVAVAKSSFIGSQKHNPDQPTQWNRDLSGDELDAMMRHLLEGDWTAVAWRAMANLQKEEERALGTASWASPCVVMGYDELTNPLRYFFNRLGHSIWRSDNFWIDGDREDQCHEGWDIQIAFIDDPDEMEVKLADLPYLELAGLDWSFRQPTHGDTYLTYSADGHGPERTLHRGVGMVGPELEGYRWVKVAG